MQVIDALNPEYGLTPEEQDVVEFAVENGLHVPVQSVGHIFNFWLIGTHYGAYFKYRLTIDKVACIATLRRVPRVIETLDEARNSL